MSKGTKHMTAYSPANNQQNNNQSQLNQQQAQMVVPLDRSGI